MREKIAEIIFNAIVDADELAHDNLLSDYGIDTGEYMPWKQLNAGAKEKHYKKADQILKYQIEEIKKEAVKLKAIPQPIFENHEGTMQEKTTYVAGFNDGVQAQLQKIIDGL